MSEHLNLVREVQHHHRVISGHSVMVLFIVLLLILVIPIGIGWWSEVPTEKILALVSLTLIFQAAAAMMGLGLGMSPVPVMASMTSVAIASMITIFELSRIVGDRSEPLNRWFRNVQNRTEKLSYLRKYGSLMLVPTIWVPGIGLFGTPVVARIFGWDRSIPVSILCMVLGWVVAIGFVIITTLQIFHVFS